ncbi:MAG: hypothetical protein NTY37_11890 [Methanothrix sp.]|nr:hypothetical protein [Methanothrix sp.]
MVNFCVLIDEDAQEFLDKLPKKSNGIAKTKLRILESDPFPGKSGDKELLRSSKHEDVYRLHISRSYTPQSAVKFQISLIFSIAICMN